MALSLKTSPVVPPSRATILTNCLPNRVEPASGTLLTFVQFLFVAVTGYISQFDETRPPFFISQNKVPLKRWMVNIILFFSINTLNNHAFSYDISVPVHIILRSGGSITTMIAGRLWGKRYSRIQIIAVVLLTIGVIVAAWSDAQTKVRSCQDKGKLSTEQAILTISRVKRMIKPVVPRASIPVWPSFSSLRFCPLLWAYIPRRPTGNTDLSGERTFFTPIFSLYPSSFPSCRPCGGSSISSRAARLSPSP